MNAKKAPFTYHFFAAAALILLSYILLYSLTEQSIFSHSVYDSYTRQAQVWWQGRADLSENIPWLELAEYNGRIFVSFPPFPSVVQFLLYPLFGMQMPDNLINTLFGFGSFVLVYLVMARNGHSSLSCALTALLLTLGSNLFYLSVTGWVWFSAQTQAFFFSVLAVYLIASRSRSAWYFSFLSLGIAFACRPFQIVYTPLLVYLLHKNLGDNHNIKGYLSCIKYTLPLFAALAATAAYNHARFDNLLEFGHHYLPEFAHAPQFSLRYVPGNFLEILKLPGIHAAGFWPEFNGTLFFLVNPAYVLIGVRLVQGRFDQKKALYTLSLLLHFVLILSHKTMGGWQFGSRYLVDMLPFAPVLFADGPMSRASARFTAVLAALGIAVNIWGAIWFYTSF